MHISVNAEISIVICGLILKNVFMKRQIVQRWIDFGKNILYAVIVKTMMTDVQTKTSQGASDASFTIKCMKVSKS